MSLVSIDWSPDAKQLRKFGLAMIVGFGIIGTMFWFGIWPFGGAWPVGTPGPKAAIGCWIFGAAAGVLGLTGTKAALVVYVPWMAVAFIMGNVISRALLTILYYGMITPFGLVMRLCGRDKLHLRRRQVRTYWCDAAGAKDKSTYERQF